MPPRFIDHRAHLARLIARAMAAAQPDVLVRDHLRRTGDVLTAGDATVHLRGRVWLLAVGKAALRMALPAIDRLGDRLTAGAIITKQPPPADLSLPPTVTYRVGGHPLPTAASIAATDAALALLDNPQREDVLLCLLSGGASALLTQPRLPLPLWQALTQALVHSGCTIQELNTVRRVFDTVKAGGLARHAAPAQVVTLILSDVIGNDLATIGSGPTVPLTQAERLNGATQAAMILRRYAIEDRFDSAERAQIRHALDEARLPPVGDDAPQPHNQIIGDVVAAAQRLAATAQALGFSAHLADTQLTGDVATVAPQLAQRARDLPPNHALIFGGELTLAVGPNPGYGGRCQALALAVVPLLADAQDLVFAAFASDGDDGVHPPDAPPVAGAVVTGASAARAAAAGLDAADYAARFDSYRFFAALGDQLSVPSGTNVNDLIVILRYAGP